MSTFQEWIRYRYGTFAEMGFENDPLYPMVYQYGAEEKSSQSCGNLTQNDQMADASIEHKVSQFFDIGKKRLSPIYKASHYQNHSNFAASIICRL